MKKSNSGIVGATLIGLGFGLTAIGIALVVPACADWSLSFAERALKKGREGMENAAAKLGEVAGLAQHHFGEATKTARATTVKAAGAVENAAKHVREYAS